LLNILNRVKPVAAKSSKLKPLEPLEWKRLKTGAFLKNLH
jgi:hypothetical protein